MKKYLQKCDTLGLELLVVAVLWYSVSDVWGRWNLGLAIAGGALVIVGIAANYRQIISSFGKRSTKHASNYVISLLLVIAIVSDSSVIVESACADKEIIARTAVDINKCRIDIVLSTDAEIIITLAFGGETINGFPWPQPRWAFSAPPFQQRPVRCFPSCGKRIRSLQRTCYGILPSA